MTEEFIDNVPNKSISSHLISSHLNDMGAPLRQVTDDTVRLRSRHSPEHDIRHWVRVVEDAFAVVDGLGRQNEPEDFINSLRRSQQRSCGEPSPCVMERMGLSNRHHC